MVCLRGVWPPCFSRLDHGGVAASGAGGYGSAANRIDRPINAMAQGGIIPGETVRAVRLRAWLGKGGGVGQAAVRMRSIWRIRAESR